MNFYLLIVLFGSCALILQAEQPVSIKLDIEKKTLIREAVDRFNVTCKDWLNEHHVPPLDYVEVSNALALGSDSYLSLEKPALAKLARTSFAEGWLPAGSSIVLRNGAWVGTSEAKARNVPFVYFFIFITTNPNGKDDTGVPSPEEIAAGSWLPIRLTKRSDTKSGPK